VPVSHAILAFNAVAAETDRIPEAAIEAMVRGRTVPADLGAADADPLYASKPVLLRRTSGSARLTVFDGGHDIVHEAGLTWLEAQRRGTPVAWDVKPHVPPVLKRPAAPSGK
jgi:hypothetical protein